jgi:glucosamine 6-phosphate synthetase-like amidotransferase/phosphosugar isomerase protein
MCGIAAILLYPQERSKEEWQEIKNIFTQNLAFNEERGRDAAGLAVFQLDGRVSLCKLPLPANEFINTRQYADLLSSVDAQTTLLLGHTRLPTKGSPANNDNNHPLHIGTVYGVHNGHIRNDDELFARYNYSRLAQVDSEIIFQLLAGVSPSLNGQYLGTVEQSLRLLQGEFTFIACDTRTPTRLLVLKQNNPLCMHWHSKWKALVFSSRYIFLRKAIGRPLSAEALPHHTLLLYDANTLAQANYQPIATVPMDLASCLVR